VKRYQPISFARKNIKRGIEKGGKCKRKRGKGERKGKIGEWKWEKGKYKKWHVTRGGKTLFSEGGINIVFGPKHRLLIR
jgi:hypothetical protein